MLSHAAPVVEAAKGDGNCAFNAFVLGFCEASVLDQLNPKDDHPFVQGLAKHLNLPAKWDALKKNLIAADRGDLQSSLAPVMRAIAIRYIQADASQKAFHLAETTAAIKVELQKYFQERRTKAPNAVSRAVIGDIFIRHPFIQQKFEELFASGQDIDAAQFALGQWWNDAGHNLFLQRMLEPAKSAANTDLYAGDLELAALGAYFNINVRVRSEARGINLLIHSANGKMHLGDTAELAGQEPALANRGLIDEFNLNWKTLSRPEVEARLNAIPQLAVVEQYIQNCVVATGLAPKGGDVVPDTWSHACHEQLIARGIISPRGTFIGVPAAELLSRIREFPLKAEVLTSYTNSYVQRPSVELQNENAAHWNNLKPHVPKPVHAAEEKGGDAATSKKPAAILTSTTPHSASSVKKPTKGPLKRSNSFSHSSSSVRTSLSSTHPAKTKKSSTTTTTSATATVKAPPYRAGQAEKEVNDAMNQVVDLLTRNSPPLTNPGLTDQEVKATFEKAFASFTKVLQAYKSNNNMTFFKQKTQEVKAKIEQDVQQLVKKPRSS